MGVQRMQLARLERVESDQQARRFENRRLAPFVAEYMRVLEG